MKGLKKILKALSILMVVGLMLIPADFAFATSADRELTDREKAAFIVRDEWTTWVRAFTASLSELDKNATSRIYDNMDFYDMQYRFTEKYKKVPEYLDEDGKPTQKLKDLIKEKRKKISGAAGVRDYLKFTSLENGATLKYEIFGSLPNIDIGYSLDGSTFIAWPANNTITLNSGESVYIWNKKNTLNTGESDRIIFRTGANFNISGNIKSMINFESLKPYCFLGIFAGTKIVDASELVLPDTTLAEYCYGHMFDSCNRLIKAPELPATNLASNCYKQMFYNCRVLTDPPSVLPAKILKESCYSSMFYNAREMVKAPEIQATTLANNCFDGMFYVCQKLNYIKILYTGDFDSAYFNMWVTDVNNIGDFYYNGEDINNFGEDAIPKDSTNKWNVHTFTSDLKFTALQTSSMRYTLTGTLIIDPANIPEMYYSYDDINWTAWPADTDVAIPNGQSLYVKNEKDTLSMSESNYVTFSMSGKISASGNINKLINDSNLSNWCYYKLFDGCTALTTLPDLPSKIIAENCYNMMFNGCTGLTEGTDLPATALKTRCYEKMFQGCTNLTGGVNTKATSVEERSCYYMFSGCTSMKAGPDLNAMTLAAGCYYGMFAGSGLTSAPELPATTLANSCYRNMFLGCQDLEYAPMNLPATTLVEYCYAFMFNGCAKLEASPEMKAETLAANCFDSMFSSCPNVDAIDITCYTGNFDSTYFNNWVSGVASSGTLYYKGTDTTTGTSAIPSTWQTKERQPLTFTSEQNNSTIQFGIDGESYLQIPDMYYSTDLITWSSWTRDTNITLNSGEKIYVKNNRRSLSTSSYRHIYFVMSGKIAASGDINSLISYSKLTQACYSNLFANCSALTSAPELPTMKLAPYCYQSMFENCTSLTSAPGLPATTIAPYCYERMFYNCDSLQTAPNLPATTLAEHCYRNMFTSSGLQTGPDIKATTLAYRCFDGMFYACTNLNTIKIAYTGAFILDNFGYWVDAVADSGTFYYSGSDTSNFGHSAIPKNSTNQWTVLPYTP